jgi:soluble lytic murein transglycosylase-like protein
MVALHFCHRVEAKDKKTFQKIYKEVKKAEKEYGVPREIILAIIQIESSFNPRAVGKSHGELGLLQTRPNLHSCSSLGIRESIQCGVAYLDRIVDRDDAGNIVLETVARFNLGPNRKVNNYRSTRYYRKIKKALKDRYWEKWLK